MLLKIDSDDRNNWQKNDACAHLGETHLQPKSEYLF